MGMSGLAVAGYLKNHSPDLSLALLSSSLVINILNSFIFFPVCTNYMYEMRKHEVGTDERKKAGMMFGITHGIANIVTLASLAANLGFFYIVASKIGTSWWNPCIECDVINYCKQSKLSMIPCLTSWCNLFICIFTILIIVWLQIVCTNLKMLNWLKTSLGGSSDFTHQCIATALTGLAAASVQKLSPETNAFISLSSVGIMLGTQVQNK